MLLRISQVLTITVLNLLITTSEYLPVFIFHGVFVTPGNFSCLVNYIKEKHNGTDCIVLDLFNGPGSYTSIWEQAEAYAESIKCSPYYTARGVHFIGFSQGGLTERATLMKLGPCHYVRSLISLTSPLMGLYGINVGYNALLNGTDKENAHIAFYTLPGQLLSYGNMWNDPCYQCEYLRGNSFLPLLNNQVCHAQYEEFKACNLKLENFVVVGGPTDEVIIPWYSSLFDYQDCSGNRIRMEDQRVFKCDTFGLRTLNMTGRFFRFEIPGLTHNQFACDSNALDKSVLPFLT